MSGPFAEEAAEPLVPLWLEDTLLLCVHPLASMNKKKHLQTVEKQGKTKIRKDIWCSHFVPETFQTQMSI